MTKVEGKEKEVSDCGRHVQQEDSPLCSEPCSVASAHRMRRPQATVLAPAFVSNRMRRRVSDTLLLLGLQESLIRRATQHGLSTK